MRLYQGRVKEVQLDPEGAVQGWISCPAGALPAPGQYTLANAQDSPEEIVSVPLFAVEISDSSFLAAAPFPHTWNPGQPLQLWGPFGHGFVLPEGLQRLALVVLENSAQRLLPLAALALRENISVALFSDRRLPSLPALIEINPISALPEALSWADFLALDMPAAALPSLRSILGLAVDEHLACPAQALIITSMPCGARANCGACAVRTQHGWKLACSDGPVFDLAQLVF